MCDNEKEHERLIEFFHSIAVLAQLFHITAEQNPNIDTYEDLFYKVAIDLRKCAKEAKEEQ